jgi:integrase
LSKEKLPKGVERLPKGVEINGNQLRISFYLNGERCREPINGVSSINKSSIAYADNKRRTILAEIKEGRFDYAAHFPDSTRGKAISGTGGLDAKRTVAKGVERWLEVQKVKRASSTYDNYASKSKHVLAWADQRRIADISKSDLELFQAQLLRAGLAPKTVNDVFTIVRGVWADAFQDGILRTNPLDRIINIARDHDDEFANPFSREEMEKIGAGDPERMPDVRMILFNCWAGLSLSEIIALAVEDVDLEAGGVHVRRARVKAEYKVPKEKARIRFVELITPALELLEEILADAKAYPGATVEVIQRDNVTRKKERITLLFRNSISGVVWSGQNVSEWFTDHLKKSKVAHRGPNQCRHTFASQAISSYVPLEWVARQLGHADTTMVKKHYGRWIPANTKSMAKIVSEMMGFKAD